MARKLKGIRRKRDTWQTYIRIAGQFYSQTWPLDTPLETLRAWHEAQRARQEPPGAPGDGFAAEIARYALKIQTMPTRVQRLWHLAGWATRLGRDRNPASITSDEVEAGLQALLVQGLANDTVRKHRSALQAFFKKQYGPRGVNPVRGTTNPPPPKVEAKSVDYLVIERMLAQMPDRQSAPPGTIGAPSLSKIRARCIAYTGLTPKLLQGLTPDDLTLTGTGRVRTQRRLKGGGVERRTLSLSPDALEAFKDFHACHAYGSFAVESLNRSIKRAFKRAGVNPKSVSLYWLKHSFLTQVYRVTRDEATVARLGMLADGSKMTARYTKGAHQDVDAAAVAAFDTSLITKRQSALKGAVAVHGSVPKVAQKVAQNR